MCGLVGVAGDVSGAWKDIFTELLLVDSVRGTHSTGAGFVGREKKVFELVKRPGDPFTLFNTVAYDKAISASNAVCAILGHNRYATVGQKTEDNAHPFKFAHVMGMHNGTLDSWALKRLKNYEKYGTDSEAIFASINDIGAKETLALIAGAWALVWVDKRDGTLNFLRNAQRPLHYCYSEDRSTIVWASESAMLTYVLGRKGKKMFIPADEKDHSGVFLVTADTHYSWKIPKFIIDKFESPERVEMKGQTWSWTNSTSSTWKPQHERNNDYAYGYGVYTDAEDADLPFLARPSTKKFRPPYKDAVGKVINKHHFNLMTKEGCCFCGQNDQSWGEFIKIMGTHTGKDTPFACEECYNNIDTYEYTKWVA